MLRVVSARVFSHYVLLLGVVACAGGESSGQAVTEPAPESGIATDVGVQSTVGATPSAETGVTSPAGSGAGQPMTSSTSPDPGPTAGPDPGPQNEPPALVSAASPGSPFEAGAPEVLLSELDFPARMAVDEARIYVANRRHLGAGGEPDQLLAMAIDGPAGESSVLFEQFDITGVAVTDTWVWTADSDEDSYVAYDKFTGEETLRALAGDYPYQVAANDEYVFWASIFAVSRVPLQGGTVEPLWLPEGRAPQWVYPTEEKLFVVTDERQPEGNTLSELVVIDLETIETTVLVPEASDRIGALASYQGDLLYNNVTAGTLNRIAPSGGTPSVVATIAEPWGLAVEGDYAYVSTQPESRFCEAAEGSVQRVSLLDGSVVVLTTEVWCPSMLAVAGNGLYWVNNGSVDDESGQVMSLTTGSLARLTR